MSSLSSSDAPSVDAVPPIAHAPVLTALTADRKQWWVQAGILTLSLGVVVTAALLSVESATQVRVPGVGIVLPELCNFRRVLGIPCPGCGLTRCFISMAHGDFQAAWNYHPIGTVFFATVLFQIPFRGWQLWRLKRGLPLFWMGRWIAWFLGTLAVLMILQWVLRIATGW